MENHDFMQDFQTYSSNLILLKQKLAKKLNFVIGKSEFEKPWAEKLENMQCNV